MAVVSTAQRGILVYQLANQPSEFKVCIVFYIKILHLHSSIGMKKYEKAVKSLSAEMTILWQMGSVDFQEL